MAKTTGTLAWEILNLRDTAEDAFDFMDKVMLLYRLDQSIERRVYKINVAPIDEADVPAYMQEIANSFKRNSVADPWFKQRLECK